MDKKILTIKPLLEVIFVAINRSAGYFADTYLLKDVSIISKWKSKKVTPKKEDISKIIEFVIAESTIIQQKTIRDKVVVLIKESSLSADIKELILCIEDFELFLEETLTISVSQDNYCFTTIIGEQENENAMGDTLIAEEDVLLPVDTSEHTEKTNIVSYEYDNLSSNPHSHKSNTNIKKIRLSPVAILALLIMAAFVLFEQLSMAYDSNKSQQPFQKSEVSLSPNNLISREKAAVEFGIFRHRDTRIGCTGTSTQPLQEVQEESSVISEAVPTEDVNEDSSIGREDGQIPEITPNNNSTNPEVVSNDNSEDIKETNQNTGITINGDNNIQISNCQDSVISIIN